jgi:hypothetical protein
MKTKTRVLLVVAGVAAAMVTAGVPEIKSVQQKILPGKGFTEAEVTYLMQLNQCSREHAIYLLELADEHAITVE